MDCCLFNGEPRFSFPSLPSENRRLSTISSYRRPLIVLASNSSDSARTCGFSGLNGPLELRTLSGRYLREVLLNQPEKFENAARGQLELLAAKRDEADERQRLSRGSEEGCLHRRVAQLKNEECQVAVEDIIYMIIFFKFSRLGVQLIPRLSQCIHHGRLEIWPPKDWELESLYNFDALEMVREHLRDIIGWNANSNVRDSWAITEITCHKLFKLYCASNFYGYFLRSASMRYCLEKSLDPSKFSISNGSYRSKHIALNLIEGCTRIPVGQVPRFSEKFESLKFYVMGFNQETVEMCANPKSVEVMNLIQKYNFALFGGEKTGLLKTNELISTSRSSLKRFMLEAVAFGYFLREAESFVNSIYTLVEI